MINYKKDYKEFYMPKAQPALIDIPTMTFIMIDGKGDPKGQEYQNAVAALYTLSYNIKMKGKALPGYYEYTVFPLEGLWDAAALDDREAWDWTSIMRQPDFVTEDIFQWAVALAEKKKPELDFSKARLESFTEGLCVQAMHTGAYAATIALIEAFIAEEALVKRPRHHEIYISDPNKVQAEKMKTVLRLPVF
jgi:hypothetical protein